MNAGSPKYLSILLVLVLLGCSEKPSTHPVFRYYPPESVFEDGYVSKFYGHYTPGNTSQSSATRIEYLLYQKTGKNSFVLETYNAGFWLNRRQHYRVEGSQLIMESSTTMRNGDTTSIDIGKGLVLDWSVDALQDPHYQVSGDYPTYAFTYQSQQIGSRDTVINDQPARVFAQESTREIMQEDTTQSTWTSEHYYVAGLGFYGMKEQLPDYSWEMELVEQMPLSKFRKLANHDEKRVAYINPKETLDQNADFKLCGHEKFIADYYNSTPDGDYLFGKSALVDTVLTHLDSEKMLNQTGMLTFRFVVNCEGEAGRFIAKGYDLNYQPYEFPEETVMHLYEQLRRLKDWRVVVIREEPSDAYFYFTFKLNNGEITDILP